MIRFLTWAMEQLNSLGKSGRMWMNFLWKKLLPNSSSLPRHDIHNDRRSLLIFITRSQETDRKREKLKHEVKWSWWWWRRWKCTLWCRTAHLSDTLLTVTPSRILSMQKSFSLLCNYIVFLPWWVCEHETTYLWEELPQKTKTWHEHITTLLFFFLLQKGEKKCISYFLVLNAINSWLLCNCCVTTVVVTTVKKKKWLPK
jgi:hypothetical protein